MSPKNKEKECFYKYSNYTIETDKLRTRKRSLTQCIDKHISKKRQHKNLLKSEKEYDKWKAPLPIFTYTGIPDPNIDND